MSFFKAKILILILNAFIVGCDHNEFPLITVGAGRDPGVNDPWPSGSGFEVEYSCDQGTLIGPDSNCCSLAEGVEGWKNEAPICQV